MAKSKKIYADKAITVSAKPEMVFDKQWPSHIRINSKSPSEAVMVVHLVPYDGGTTLDEPKEQVVISNIFEAMQDETRPVELRTLYAQVMELLLQTIKAEKAYQKALSVAESVVDHKGYRDG